MTFDVPANYDPWPIKSLFLRFAPSIAAAATVIFVVVLLHFNLATSRAILPAADDAGANAWLDAALFDQAMRTSLDRFGGLPGANPYVNGGILLGAHPADGSLSPLSFTLLPFDAIRAIRLKTLIALLIGTLGLYLTARGLGAGRPASLASSLWLPASGFVQDRLASAPLDLQLLPVIVAVPVILFAEAQAAWAVLAASLVTLAAFQSGSLVLFFFPAAALCALLRIRQNPDDQREAGKIFIMSVAFALVFCTVKWIPAVDLLDATHLRKAAESFLRTEQTGFGERARNLITLLAPKGAPWLLLPFLILAAVGSYFEGVRGKVSILALLFILMSILPAALLDADGNAGAWMAIRPLSLPQSAAPVFALAALGALCALALDKLIGRHRRTGLAAAAVFALAACVPFLWVRGPGQIPVPRLADLPEMGERAGNFYPVFLGRMGNQPPPDTHPTIFIREGFGVTNALAQYAPNSRVSPRARVKLKGPKYWPNGRYEGEVSILRKAGEVVDFHEAANRLDFTVTTTKPKVSIIVNRNYRPDWRARGGRLENAKGMLSVLADEAGPHRIVLINRPVKVLYGMALSAVGLLLALLTVALETTGLGAKISRWKVVDISGFPPTRE